MSVMIPIIKVKDIHSDNEHIVGTDSHDRLIVENNALHYLNIQCMDGTRYGGDYHFVGKPDEDCDLETEIEFVTLEEFAKLYDDILKKQNDNEQQLQALFKDIFARKKAAEELKHSEGYVFHT